MKQEKVTERKLLQPKESNDVEPQTVQEKVLEPLNKMWRLLNDFDDKEKEVSETEWIEKFDEHLAEQAIVANSPEASKILSGLMSIFKLTKPEHPFHQKIVSLVQKHFTALIEISADGEDDEDRQASWKAHFVGDYLSGIIVNSIPTDKVEEIVALLNSNLSIYKEKIKFWLNNDSRIIDLIIDYGPVELKEELLRVIKVEVEENNCSDLYFLAKNHDSWKLQTIFDQLILERMNQLFDIDIDLFLASGHSSTEIDWSTNLATMKSIEEALPGAVKKLWSEYGIHEFNRYPKNILLDQIKEENIDRPYNVIFFPYADHNGAFDNKDIFREVDYLEKFYDSTKQDFALKIFETGATHQTLEYLIKLKRTYGKHKISNMVLGGHGNTNSLYFNEVNDSKTENYKLDKRMLQKKKKTFKFVGQFFEENATIVLISCSTGAEKGFASELSEVTNLRVIAPKKDAGLTRLEMKDGAITPTYTVEAAEYKPKA